MTSTTRAVLIIVIGAVVNSGCRRADLYAITGDPDRGAGDGGTGGAADGQSSDSATGGAGNSSASNSASGGVGNGSASNSATGGTSDSTSNIGGTGGRSTKGSTCPGSVLQPGDRSVTLQVGSASRSYVLHVPSAYDGRSPVPLLLDFHGIGSTGWGELSSSPYPAVTDPEGVVMAFPDGLKGPAGTGWNVGPCCVDDVDDVAFARAVVADVRKTACIDDSRVYAVGVLTGGGMAYYLACNAADEFAAVAPAAFDLLEENVEECKPTRPITVISFRGNAASRVPYDGGSSSLVSGMSITFLGAKETFAQWAQIDGCTGPQSQEDSTGCSSYSACEAGVEVILCTKQGGGLDPGDPSIAWPVLKRHSL